MCCEKNVCSGCVWAPVYDNRGKEIGKGWEKCPFCRTPTPTSEEEYIKWLKKRMEVGDAHGMNILGTCYYKGSLSLPRDYDKALKLWHRAGELGYAKAYNNIGNAYHLGVGVERDNKKAEHYYELAAIRGNAMARHNLGYTVAQAGNWDRALKHYMIAAGGGDNDSVKYTQKLYIARHATKEDYLKALQTYQAYLDEVKSDQRDTAAAVDDRCKYY